MVRKINTKHAQYYKQLFTSRTISELAEGGLLLATDLESEDEEGCLWLKQIKVRPLTYVFEWPAVMIHEAAGACLRLHAELVRRGHCLVDSHPWNTVMSHGPKWVDIGSIVEYDGGSLQSSLKQCEDTYFALLELIDMGLGNVARAGFAHAFVRLEKRHGGMWTRRNPERPAFVGRRIAGHAVAALSSLGSTVGREVARSTIQKSGPISTEVALKEIARLSAKLARQEARGERGRWSQYSQAGLEPLEQVEIAGREPASHRFENAKFRSVHSLLRHCRSSSESLLDLACNRGMFSIFGAMMGYRVTGIDVDEGALVDLHGQAKRCDVDVSIILNDIVAPIEAQGLSLNPLPSLQTRTQSDCVLCLALMHHLFFGQYRMSLRAISDLLARFTNKWLILEYVPLSDKHLGDNYDTGPRGCDYSKEALLEAAATWFTLEQSLESFPAGRELLLLRKK